MEDHGRETGMYARAIEEQIRDGARLQDAADVRDLMKAGAGPLPLITQTSNPRIGIGGAPTRCTTLPADAKARKTYPVASGVLDYFPDAIAAVARVSWQGNEQHNPGQPLHWARDKSTDEADTLMRHFLERGTLDKDGIRHSAKMVWRALAFLQKEIEAEQTGAKANPAPRIGTADVRKAVEEIAHGKVTQTLVATSGLGPLPWERF